MQAASQDKPTKGPKRACTECRQQKAKCDSHLNPDHTCSRCRRLNLPCFISEAFKRQHKRERLSELEQEAEALRKKLRTSDPADTQLFNTPEPKSFLTPLPPSIESQTTTIRDSLQARIPPSESAKPNGTVASSTDEPTISRSLNGTCVTAREIDDIFQIFFRDYSRFLQVLDSKTSPNEYFAQSEFLFWSIIGVACRKYSKHTALFATLSPNIIDLALLSTNSSSRPIFIIQGLLLLLNWPPLRDYSKLDVTYPLAGLLMHKAKQIGLHQPHASHEFHFSNERIFKISEAEIATRSDLWVRCMIIYQRTCLSKGQLPQHLPAHPNTTNSNLRLQIRCDDIVTHCCTSVVKLGIQDLNPGQEKALAILLDSYSDQVKDIEIETFNDKVFNGDITSWDTSPSIGTFYLQTAQLNIQVFHLYGSNTITFESPLASLLTTACKVLDAIEGLFDSSEAPPAPPHYITYALLQSTFVLLRLLKSPRPRGVDIERATSRLSFGIDLAKKWTLHNKDISAKTALFLTQMWNSPKSFRHEDGSPDMGVRVYNRLTMGPVMDIVWRWYDLFEEHAKLPYGSTWSAEIRKDVARNIAQPASQTSAPVSAPALAADAADAPSAAVDFPSGDLFPDMNFTDFDWVLGDDFFTL